MKIPTCRQIEQALFEMFPAGIAEDWDNIGLLAGDPDANVSRVLVALDLTSEVVREAVEGGVQLILTHHPILFKGVRQVLDIPGEGALLHALIRHGIAHIAMHTNLDSGQGGLNDYLAQALEVQHIRPLGGPQNMMKVVTFVPNEHLHAVFEAMAAAGAGRLGAYTHCSFQGAGTGTFLPDENARPFIGEAGRLEYVQEVRLESIVEACDIPKVLDALCRAHPYEQPAYDVFALNRVQSAHGTLRIGELKRPAALGAFAGTVKAVLGADAVQVVGSADRLVSRVAVCTGSGGSFMHIASEAGADVYLTGEAKHSDMLLARETGLSMIVAGHYYTERLAETLLIERLQQAYDRLQYMGDILVTQTIAPYETL